MRFGLFLISLSFLASCAQVGQLSGGPEDNTAPIPDSARMSPANETKNFKGKQWIIPFDEFVSLNNPTETMVVIPPNIQPKASLKGKKLVISWEEDLSPNTTYAFYLNGTIQDITEKNDSLMTFVFSTGDQIDSLSYENRVVDAITGEPLQKFTIGLYEKFSDTIRPNYVGQTDRMGIASLGYMKEGTYEVAAFEDKNRNLKPDADERFGFLSETVVVNGELSDSLVIRAYSPAKKKRINNVNFIAPQTICVSAAELQNSTVFVNGIALTSYHSFAPDSALFYLPQTDSTKYRVVVQNDFYQDTARLQITNREKIRAPQLKLNMGTTLVPYDSAFFFSTALITGLNLEKIYGRYIEEKDTTNSNVPYLELRDNKVFYTDYNRSYDQLTLTFEPGAIQYEAGSNTDTLRFTFTNKKAADLGLINLRTANFSGSHLIEMLQDGKTIRSFYQTENGDIRIPYVLPGEYSFRVLIDRNNNGKWDGGDWKTVTQPEEYIYFQEKKKVRANWEMEIELNYAQ